MNLGTISDQLPTYPNNIQGELRLILQTKDVFLVCYKHLEEYRRLVNEQNRLITKEFVQEQLQIGEDEISELKIELQDAEAKLNGRLRHNELLADHLASLGFASLEAGASVRHLALCRSPQMRKNLLAQRQGSHGSRLSEPRPPTHMIDNIALAIAEIHQEVRSKVKPLLDYYRDLFYLQLHFTLVLGQVCNYCMPLVTENIGLIDRIFFWSERPEFDLVRRAADIGDRLKEIYTRAQTVLGVLAESVRFLQSKVELQKTLEQRFHERLDEQQKTKDKILREVHTTKQNMDMLEEENDRLVGSLVKVDPTFVDSRHFYELAEGGSLMGAKKPSDKKDLGQHNVDDVDMMNSNSPNVRRPDSAVELERNIQRNRSARRSRDLMSPSCLDNPTDEMNNNKALSMASETPAVAGSKVKARKNASQEDDVVSLKDIATKTTNSKNRGKQTPKASNRNNITRGETPVISVGDGGDNGREANTPTPRRSTRRTVSQTRSKSRNREAREDRSPSTERKTKLRRRANSAERQPKENKTRKVRSKSTVGERKVRERTVRDRVTKTPEKMNNEKSSFTTSSNASGDSAAQQEAPVSLKSRLLGRTRDILEAAMHRAPKSSTAEQVTHSVCDLDTSFATRRLDQEDLNNDAITSVSSFASLVMDDSPLGEIGRLPGSTDFSNKQFRSTPSRKMSRNAGGTEKQSKRSRTRKQRYSDDLDILTRNPLPALANDTLLTEHGKEAQLTPSSQTFDIRDSSKVKQKGRKLKKLKNESGGNLVDFLSGTALGALPSSQQQSSLPSPI